MQDDKPAIQFTWTTSLMSGRSAGYLAVQRLKRSTTLWGASQGALQQKKGDDGRFLRVLTMLRWASQGTLQPKPEYR